MKDVEGTVEFLALLSAMASRLSERGRAIFDLGYNGLSFGNWSMTAGTRKKRVYLGWDGRESSLVIRTAQFSDSQSHPKWNELPRRTIDAQSTPELLALAEALVLEHSS